MRIVLPALLSFICYSSFSQYPAPTLLFNNVPPQNGTIEAYFLPVTVELTFLSKDTLYTVKKGKVIFNRHNQIDTVMLTSNTAVSGNALPGKSIEVIVEAVEVKVRNAWIKSDTTTFKKTIPFKSIPVTEKEVEWINTSTEGTLELNGKEVKSADVVTLKTTNQWSVKGVTSFEIAKIDFILLRKNRPVATANIRASEGEEAFLKQHVEKGDYLLIRIYDATTQKVKSSKVIFVK